VAMFINAYSRPVHLWCAFSGQVQRVLSKILESECIQEGRVRPSTYFISETIEWS